MKDNRLILSGVLTLVFLFATIAMPQGIWISSDPVNAQTDSSNQTAVLDQLVSNLTQAKEAASSGNSTAVTMALAGVIAELSDALGKVTTDDTAENSDEHTHFINHKGHTHTVTHQHPHHSDHHHHDSGNWFEKHHEFNPSNCKPGLMC